MLATAFRHGIRKCGDAVPKERAGLDFDPTLCAAVLDDEIESAVTLFNLTTDNARAFEAGYAIGVDQVASDPVCQMCVKKDRMAIAFCSDYAPAQLAF